MDISVFRRLVWTEFGGSARNHLDADPARPMHTDPCPEIEGMLSPRKQRLLNLAYGLLPPDEAYLESAPTTARASSRRCWATRPGPPMRATISPSST